MDMFKRSFTIVMMLLALVPFGNAIAQPALFQPKPVEPPFQAAYQPCPQEYGLISAAEAGDEEKVQALLKEGADVNQKGGIWDRGGETALHAASTPKIVKMLLEAGADVHSISDWGKTPLHAAASKGNAEIIQLLLAAGADVHAKDKNGNKPGAYSDSMATVEIFKKSGDPDAQVLSCESLHSWTGPGAFLMP